jgi:hypothetical protein
VKDLLGEQRRHGAADANGGATQCLPGDEDTHCPALESLAVCQLSATPDHQEASRGLERTTSLAGANLQSRHLTPRIAHGLESARTGRTPVIRQDLP